MTRLRVVASNAMPARTAKRARLRVVSDCEVFERALARNAHLFHRRAVAVQSQLQGERTG